MKKIISVISALWLCVALAVSAPCLVNAETQDTSNPNTYTEEELINHFNQAKDNGKLETAIANILKESDKEGNVTIGSPVEINWVNLPEKKIKHYSPSLALPISQNSELLGVIKFTKIFNPGTGEVENRLNYYTFIPENFYTDFYKPDTELALFMLTNPTPEYASGIFGIDRNNNHYILFKYSDYPADISALTFENVDNQTNIITAEDLKQNENFVYSKTIDVTLGAGIEEPIYS